MTHALFSIEMPLELHHSTADLVTRFAHVLAEKLLLAQRKHGYQDRWLDASNAGDHRRELMRHIYKGDPLDVAAYCAFLWHHGEHTRPEDAALEIEGPYEDGSISICFGKHSNHEDCKLEKFVPEDTAHHRRAVEERVKRHLESLYIMINRWGPVVVLLIVAINQWAIAGRIDVQNVVLAKETDRIKAENDRLERIKARKCTP